MGRKKTEEAIADSRVGRVAGPFGSVDELLADLKADDTPENLESWLHEKAGPAYDALKADPARAVTPDQVRRTLDELLTEALRHLLKDDNFNTLLRAEGLTTFPKPLAGLMDEKGRRHG